VTSRPTTQRLLHEQSTRSSRAPKAPLAAAGGCGRSWRTWVGSGLPSGWRAAFRRAVRRLRRHRRHRQEDATRTDMQHWTGCIAGALSADEYRAGLTAEGLTDIVIAGTNRVHRHASSVVIRAIKLHSTRWASSSTSHCQSSSPNAHRSRRRWSSDASSAAKGFFALGSPSSDWKKRCAMSVETKAERMTTVTSEFGEDRCDVGLDGLESEEQFGADLVISQPGGDET
jgi:hypothetical protein